MLQSLISLDMNQLTLNNILIVLISATLLGLVFAGVFVLTHKNTVYERAFTTTLVMMPVVISVIIMLVSNNLARAFSLAGVFTLVRFRTAIADSRDIAYILGSVGIGLSAALGYIAFALVITVFLAVVLIGLSLLSKNQDVTNHARLRVIIPENLNYANVFDDIFKDFMDSWRLQRVKTTDFGTLFELTYVVRLKKDIDQKMLIDLLRERNGNLTITLTSDYVSLMSTE
ncbi:MAG: DUF4956 domain-containing protein [Acholeplasmataceae bacterium]|nr:DUF4956 domain-containing protein [Acholeplasmataceae bacterium]